MYIYIWTKFISILTKLHYTLYIMNTTITAMYYNNIKRIIK